MQTKTYEVVTVPSGPPEDMAAMIQDAYMEAHIDGGHVVAVHSFHQDPRLANVSRDLSKAALGQRSLFVVVECPLEAYTSSRGHSG